MAKTQTKTENGKTYTRAWQSVVNQDGTGTHMGWGPWKLVSGGNANGGTQSGGGSGTGGGSTGSGVNEREMKEKKYKALFNSLFPDSNRGKFDMPKELLDAAIAGDWDAARVSGWVRNNRPKMWVSTKLAMDRAVEINKYLESIFGRFDDGTKEAKAIAALVKRYVMSQADKWPIGKYISDVVTSDKNAFFQSMFPGWEEFSHTAAGQTDILSAINNYKSLRDDYTRQYRKSVSDLNAKMPDELLRLALQNNWTVEEIDTWVRQNDPAWMGSGTASDKGMDFDDFWETIFGEDIPVDAELKALYQKGKDTVTLTDFFNDYIEDSDAFNDANPSYKDWKKSQIGTPGDEAHVDPFLYFKRRAELKLAYDKWIKGKGEINWDLIDKALANNWDEERMLIEFKSVDSQYANTDEYKERGTRFNEYWQELFGMNARPDQAMAAEYISSNLSDPSDMFNRIRESQEFKSQYGNWDTFAAAQDAAGNTGAILNNPALYKSYRNTIRAAFERYGLAAPDDYTLFKSGVDEQEVAGNVGAYVASAPSYRWMTGQEADVNTAAGLGDRKAGGDLRTRLNKALTQQRVYTQSQFVTNRREEQQGSGFVTQKI